MPVTRASRVAAKRRFILAVMHVSCIILSQSPTVVAPPEREIRPRCHPEGVPHGQPEMDQVMDNMVFHGILLKKTGPGAIDYPTLLTSKTSSLLDEAEQALSTMNNSKEKQWVEAFVQRMRAIAQMLEKTAEMSNQNLPKNLNSVSGTPVPEGLPSQPAVPAPSAVRGSNPFQKPKKMMSKFPVTSPELSQVLPDNEFPSESQAVTKPAMMSKNQEDDEDDELVRELKSLHQTIVSEIPVQSSTVILPTPDTTSPAPPPVYPESVGANMTDVELEKAKLKEKLLEEITMYQHLGGEMPEEIINAVNGNPKDSTQGSGNMPETEARKAGVIKGGMFDPVGIERLDDIANEEKQISKKNFESLNVEKNNPHPGDLQIKENRTFQNINLNLNLNLPAFRQLDDHMSSINKDQTYQRGPENAGENFPKQNPFNYPGNYRFEQQQNHMPNVFRQRMLRQGNRMYNGYLPAANYNEYLAKTRYRPYPYTQHWNHSNSTLNFPHEVSPYVMKTSVNQHIDTQLNDEMKRQLRDGKIVVLSDSVVRSNFGTKEDKTNGNENIKAKVDINGKKNDTPTPN